MKTPFIGHIGTLTHLYFRGVPNVPNFTISIKHPNVPKNTVSSVVSPIIGRCVSALTYHLNVQVRRYVRGLCIVTPITYPTAPHQNN